MAISDQHILIDDLVLHNIIEYADLHHRDVVLEIGAGTGVLTEELRKRACKVIAIESDAAFAEMLNRRFENTNVEIIHGNALKVEFPEFSFNKIVSNLPYSISSEITFKLLKYPFKMAVLMYQYEFARRMAAPHGSKEYGKLSICVQYRARVELLEIVPPEAFSPEPSVRSAIVSVTPHAPEYEVSYPAFFSRFLTAVFSQRRKKLKNSITAFTGVKDLKNLGITGEVLDKRPEELPAAELALISDKCMMACQERSTGATTSTTGQF
uniref:Probable ribosomal RNA small subunit methyltransferase A n=1 Tax=Candidatus Methanogaster sp. ANME-2c ERB4 TaxID=2759911 RepID=A0A7G9YKL1_9EURY|nr:ribosomal RNA small subunit methyltransferase A [Methanosarcinales archaeon ANME-2c ERB4]QNO48948.1 ribosomal RNA small subunit methyltransferase A [Methanosarcinales archaeon ANME-2c ERB4]